MSLPPHLCPPLVPHTWHKLVGHILSDVALPQCVVIGAARLQPPSQHVGQGKAGMMAGGQAGRQECLQAKRACFLPLQSAINCRCRLSL